MWGASDRIVLRGYEVHCGGAEVELSRDCIGKLIEEEVGGLEMIVLA